MSLISGSPYYDKYDKSKNYTQILAVPGRVAQAREITEIQSTVKGIIKSLGDSLMNDGDVIEGCELLVDLTERKVTVTPGRIYLNGLILELGKSEVAIDGTGEEKIGVRLVESIVTLKDDPSLADPALGHANYSQPGCDRLKTTAEVIKVNEAALGEDEIVAIIATLVDGELLTDTAPKYSELERTLAERTYDESGSYIVEGLETRVTEDPDDIEKFLIIVEKGKAYVHGYEVSIPAAKRISVERSLESVPTEITKTYNSSTPSYQLTTGPYVKAINTVKCRVEHTDQVTISSTTGAVLSKKDIRTDRVQPVVTSGDQTIPSTNYYIETSTTLNNYIRWNAGYEFPTGNVNVTYEYRETLTSSDYSLIVVEGNHHLKLNDTSATEIIEEDSPLDISLNKYLARKDTVYLTQERQVVVVKGLPADYGTETAPEMPEYVLPLATVMSPPGGTTQTLSSSQQISVNNVGLTRFTMRDIHSMLNRMKTMEYDQAVLSLNNEAKGTDTTNKRGIFTDAFLDVSKLSLDYNLNNDGTIIDSSKATFDVGVDLDYNIVHLPLIHEFLDTPVATDSNYHKYANTVSLKTGTPKVVLSQMSATKSMLIAPYLQAPQTPEVTITPASDTWYEDTILYVYKSISDKSIVKTKTRNVLVTAVDPSYHAGGLLSVSNSSSTKTTPVGVQTQTLVQTDLISETLLPFIRQRTVTVTGKHYPANLDNIKCYFEGVFATMTPDGVGTAGTETGSIKANNSGKFKATFEIPNGIRTGTRLVEFQSDNIIEGYSSSAYAYYTAKGIARTYQSTITTITTVLYEREIINTTRHYYYDPLAQTFVLDTNTLISAVDVYFESVPTGDDVGDKPVTCEIRGVTDGNINSRVYGEMTLEAKDITVSNDGTAATRFNFPDPVMCEANTEYAIVLKANDSAFRVYVAEYGEKDIRTKKLVSNNPYIHGVLMSSSNNSTWTSHQKADLKFGLISDTYENESIINFQNVTVPGGFCRFTLGASSLLFDETSINWEYSVDNGATYSPITPGVPGTLSELKTQVKLRAKLTKTATSQLSPIINLDSVGLEVSRYDNSTDTYYISKQITGLDPYTDISVVLDTYKLNGTSIEVYVSTDSSNESKSSLLKLTQSPDKDIDGIWSESTYSGTVPSATTCRLFIKLSSPSQASTPVFRKLRAIMS